ncbi:MAG: hypothetical protein KAI57_03975 [Candidatus Pacebacteria bacterium]|nr:hypothetical protein [Candidatus Paceibacterota bacterium]
MDDQDIIHSDEPNNQAGATVSDEDAVFQKEMDDIEKAREEHEKKRKNSLKGQEKKERKIKENLKKKMRLKDRESLQVKLFQTKRKPMSINRNYSDIKD